MNMHAKHTADATTVEEGLAIQEAQAVHDSESATALAMQNTLLTPRFYTTDFDELDAIDVTSVRKEWDVLLDQMRSDPNKGHFKRTDEFDDILGTLSPELQREYFVRHIELADELYAAERANRLVVDEGIPFREAYRRIAAVLRPDASPSSCCSH